MRSNVRQKRSLIASFTEREPDRVDAVNWKYLAVTASFVLWLFAGAIRVGAVVGTGEVAESGEPLPGINHWETWKLNWQSNLLGYVAVLLLVIVLLSSAIQAVSRWRA